VAAEIWLAIHEDESGRSAARGHGLAATGRELGWIIWPEHVPVHRVAFEASPSKEWLANRHLSARCVPRVGGGEAWLMDLSEWFWGRWRPGSETHAREPPVVLLRRNASNAVSAWTFIKRVRL
jgi:hypothetical protein